MLMPRFSSVTMKNAPDLSVTCLEAHQRYIEFYIA
jgi:hypothetical protein